jgi:hypothetical protein
LNSDPLVDRDEEERRLVLLFGQIEDHSGFILPMEVKQEPS